MFVSHFSRLTARPCKQCWQQLACRPAESLTDRRINQIVRFKVEASGQKAKEPMFRRRPQAIGMAAGGLAMMISLLIGTYFFNKFYRPEDGDFPLDEEF